MDIMISAHKRQKTNLEHKRRILVGARKAWSSLAKVIEMLESDVYCIDTLQQALAVQGLWKSVIKRIFAQHLRTCFSDAIRSGNRADQERVVAEVIRVMELAERT